jgi:hypothetical protein
VERDTACFSLKIQQQFARDDGRAIVALVNCRSIVKAHNEMELPMSSTAH